METLAKSEMTSHQTFRWDWTAVQYAVPYLDIFLQTVD